ncbi:ATP-binding cassette domain-containing protein, partial [bacterium]|nr:ATP-binding cassette domain-containing protein [bacterium]
MIELKNLSFRYSGRTEPVLQNISLSWATNRLTALAGPSGSGKSTLLRVISGFAPGMFKGERLGSASVNGYDPAAFDTLRRSSEVGVVFAQPQSQLTGICATAAEEIAWGPENLGLPPEEIAARVQKYARAMKIEHLLKQHPEELSGGQQQRLAIASVMAMEPKILLLDEPAAALDPLGRQELIRLIKDYAASHTVVWASAKLEEALQLPSWTFILDGQLIYDGPASAQALKLLTAQKQSPQPPLWLETWRRLASEDTDKLPPADEAAFIDSLPGLVSDRKISGAEAVEAEPTEAQSSSEAPFTLKLSNIGGQRPFSLCAVRDLSLELQSPERIFICGPNGSGKTTLARIIAGLTRADHGTILISGRNIQELTGRQRASQIGFVFADPRLQIFSASVREEIALGPRCLGLPPEQIEKRVAEAAELTGLRNSLDSHPYDLCASRLCRLAIASILAMHTPCLIFDEPTACADREFMRFFTDILDYLKYARRVLTL